jgi:hypothetical protein
MIRNTIIAITLFAAFASAAASACPLGSHPVCEYVGGRSVCHCVR